MENFEDLCLYVESNTTEEMIQNLVRTQSEVFNLKKSDEENTEDFFNKNFKPMGHPDFKYFCGRIANIKEYTGDYKKIYNTLADQISKATYYHILAYDLKADKKHIIDAYSTEKQYFIEELIDFNDIKVYADCGGLEGKTTVEALSYCCDIKSVYLYEPIPASYQICVERMKKIDSNSSIHVRNNVVSDQKCSLAFMEEVEKGGSSRKNVSGDLKLSAITLDEDINESIDYIKMDIGGNELQAINGAVKHIKNDCPYLAICVYHKDSDLWEIPKRILEINPNYRFVLRHHCLVDYTETVLYGVPLTRIKRNEELFQSSGILDEKQRLKLLFEIYYAEMQQVLRSRLWIYDHYYTLQKEVGSMNKTINELKSWSSQLDEAKEYFIKEGEKKQEIIDQLIEQHNADLEEVTKMRREKENIKHQLDLEIAKPWYKKKRN